MSKSSSLDNFMAQQRQMSLRTKMVTAMVGVSVVTSLIVAGCGGGGSSNAQPTSSNRYFVPFTAQNDVAYIDAIVPHHMHAIEMSDIELQNGSSSAAKALAQQFKTKQTEEITLLKAARKALTGNENVPAPPMDQHNMNDLARQRAATGAQADKEFLDNMINHHAEGISIAHRAYPRLSRADVIANADDVYNTQAKEIGQMIALRGTTTQTGR
ncbi:putative conserved protein, DUF305 family [Abditibacterium utsteinense]|uniref:Putative conserved protein, DUF305 family n=1 Tax=Abditibacterium utsteinense TaxID=1960156 RepID=A0A2S8SPH5_9BACT|nr:DUF305 domain-containing protein [Abditibacterium utsteinense]PQV62702.1 putative conserved protein, DUF305 family [Abditibacterium utsteinense]